MSLKELTKEQHQNAERQNFASTLMSGNISKTSYLKYITNQFHCYSALENHSLFNLPDDRLKRSKKILEDVTELKDELNKKNVDLEKMITQSTKDYIQHVSKISREEDYLAHIYVRYLGDLRGGTNDFKKSS